MTYYLLLGGNLGNRLDNLTKARQLLAQQLGRVTAQSAIYETAAWGATAAEQPNYLNQAVAVQCHLAPAAALQKILSIETSMGRTRTAVQYAPRTIDIDILLIDEKIVNLPTLTVPHPRLHTRNFALIPLMEIAGEVLHPILELTIDELYERCDDDLEVYTLDD
jgi:2-amino-4-hydroxy-6-hydroxymethyldihydropteridine diphosphokinase